MRKINLFFIITIVAIFASMPAMAIENKIEGSWFTNFVMQKNFDGDDWRKQDLNAGNYDYNGVWTETDINYTAIINDNLKLINRVRLAAEWGSGEDSELENVGKGSFGEIGTEGLGVKVVHSYADVTWGALNAKIGAQDLVLSRGFLFNEDFTGLTMNIDLNKLELPLIGKIKLPLLENINIPIYWIKVDEGGIGDNINKDFDIYAIAPKMNIVLGILEDFVKDISFQPFFMYSGAETLDDTLNLNESGNYQYENINFYHTGFNFDANITLNPILASIWATGIYNFGNADIDDNNTGIDEKTYTDAWLAAAGGSATINIISLRGQAIYASGNDVDSKINDNNKAFVPPPGACYYWAEIMGEGVFDNQVSAGSPGTKLSNIMAFNGGFTLKPKDLPFELPFNLNEHLSKITIEGDVWYAKYVEDRFTRKEVNKDINSGQFEEDTELGIEIDAKVTYQIVENMDVQFIGAYLIASDAVYNGENKQNPYEVGLRLSLEY